MTTPSAPRRLAAIMFTDMVGYSALTQHDEALALSLLTEHNALLRQQIGAHSGREIKTVGDAFMVEFASALDATRCAIAIQHAIYQRNRAAPEVQALQIRIGIHLGDVVSRDNDVFGDGVNIAARIESATPAGGIGVSQDVARQVQNKLAYGLVNLGRTQLKNIDLPVEIYAVVLPWLGSPPGMAAAQAPRRRGRIILASTVLTAMLAAGAWLHWGGGLALLHSSAPASQAAQSIAVMPFADLSQAQDQSYFSDGLAEELLNVLTRVPDLKVIARSSSFSFRGKGADVASIAKALNVSTIIEGSVRKSADRIRITAQLIRAADSRQLWSQSYDRSFTDIFAIQDEIANAVVDALKIKLLPAQRATLAKEFVPRPEAYDQYLLARQLMVKGAYDTNLRAQAALTKAVALDPNYSAAYSQLALDEFFLSQSQAEPGAKAQLRQQALQTVEKAIAASPVVGDAFATRGLLRYVIGWDWAGAQADLSRAVQMDPNDSRIAMKLARLEATTGNVNGALQRLQRATEMDPLFSPPWEQLANLQIVTGDYAHARNSINRARAITPESRFPAVLLLQATLLDGQLEQARKLALAFNDPLDRLYGLALVDYDAGKLAASTGALNQVAKLVPDAHYAIAQLHARRGESDEAFKRLDKALAERSEDLLRLPFDPFLSKLHADPRFKAMLLKMKLPAAGKGTL